MQPIFTTAGATGSFISDVPLPAEVEGLNVKSFGAIGDGVADDDAAMQAAFNAAGPGDTVFVPAGIFLVDRLVFPTAGVKLKGVPGGGSEIRKRTVNSANLSMIEAFEKDNIEVSDITLNGQGTLQSWWIENPYAADGYVFADNLRFTTCHGLKLTNIISKAAGAAGIRMFACHNFTVTNPVGENNGFGTVVIYDRSGTQVDSDRALRSGPGQIIGGSANNDYCDSFRIICCDDLVVDGVTANNVRTIDAAPDQFAGFFIFYVLTAEFRNCHGHGNSNRGFDGGISTFDILIEDCDFSDNRMDALLLGDYRFTVRNCNLSGNDFGGLATAGVDHQIINCDLRDNGTYGVYFDRGPVRLHLTDCDCRGNPIAIDSRVVDSEGFQQTGTITT